MNLSTAVMTLLLVAWHFDDTNGARTSIRRGLGSKKGGKKSKKSKGENDMPNIIVFLVDDLGYNQVGFHANPNGNNEIHTPSIDSHAENGIKMERGYMMPWCAPSRAALQTGTSFAFNENITNDQYSFDEDIGFAGGIPPGLETIPKALNRVAARQGKEYKTSYAGKWGIGGSAWLNSPQGVGYDKARVFWGDSIDQCDGWVPVTTTPGTNGAPLRWSQGYFDQFEERPTYPTEQCHRIDQISDDILSQEEKDIACKTLPRTPPDLIDLDLLKWTQGVIETHDYSKGPLFHMHSTQGLHSPMRYPSYYDNNPSFDQPDWFKDGHVKQPLTNNDARMKTANLMRFIDDLFDGVMQSIKEAGQWDNTFVLFSSDNGGAVYPNGQVNQNFPLRGSKRSNFDGGLRVAQFLSGGWIDKNTHKDRINESGTYVFALDWAPTLVEIAGGTAEDLFQDGGYSEGKATYGDTMWEYIKNSVENKNKKQNHQKPRQVAYTTSQYFNVTEDTMFKYWHTWGKNNLFVRKWHPRFPEGTEVVPDFSMISPSPCRDKDGNPLDCCYTEPEIDPSEDHPISDVDCSALEEKANSLYLHQEACEQFPILCINPRTQNITMYEVPKNFENKIYSYWSWNGGAPYLNKTGFPVGDPSVVDANGEQLFPQKCDCVWMDDDLDPSEVNGMFVGITLPSLCINSKDPKWSNGYNNCPSNAYNDKGIGEDVGQCWIDCDGSFSRVPRPNLLDGFAAAGIDKISFERVVKQEQQHGPGGMTVGALYPAIQQYVWREGYTRWPDASNWPFIEEAGLSTCTEKGATAISMVTTAAAPWSVVVADSANRTAGGATDLCQNFNESHSWCPAYQNPLQVNLSTRPYGEDGTSYTFADGTTNRPIPIERCGELCPSASNTENYTGYGDAYVGGDGPMGICVKYDDRIECK